MDSFVTIRVSSRKHQPMSNSEEEDADDEDDPAVPLGDGPSIQGAPVARVASRLHYPIEKSQILTREGETQIRTPTGPQELASILAETDTVYFETSQAFTEAIREVIGLGPIPPVESSSSESEPADDEGFAVDEG